MLERAMAAAAGMGFLVNRGKSFLIPLPPHHLAGYAMGSRSATVRVSEVNAAKLHHRLCRASVSLIMSWSQWEFHLGSLTFAAEVTPRGWLRLRRIVKAVNAGVSVKPRDMPRPMPPQALLLLGTWLVESVFSAWRKRLPPPPVIFVMSDASDVGWGYQSSDGRQDFGGCVLLKLCNELRSYSELQWLLSGRRSHGSPY
ncbi:hypothetical protein GWK47_025631 [Chionoecetes opilio]|uniref:Uncharacterized protein n=1 Tax=Chionoecetes opilio TaxID=41210 RepID=A0A8J8WG11_CHIOP|nr:hypothetical protein GWK47_025631 [Chionoecetes opilio]